MVFEVTETEGRVMQNHPNRGRIAVTLGDGWREFTHQLLNCKMLGVVACGDSQGALAKHRSGRYCMVTKDIVTTHLPSGKVEAALRAARSA